MVPGLRGRLEGPRLYVTPREAALIREHVTPVAARESETPLRAVDIVIREGRP